MFGQLSDLQYLVFRCKACVSWGAVTLAHLQYFYEQWLQAQVLFPNIIFQHGGLQRKRGKSHLCLMTHVNSLNRLCTWQCAISAHGSRLKGKGLTLLAPTAGMVGAAVIW